MRYSQPRPRATGALCTPHRCLLQNGQKEYARSHVDQARTRKCCQKVAPTAATDPRPLHRVTLASFEPPNPREGNGESTNHHWNTGSPQFLVGKYIMLFHTLLPAIYPRHFPHYHILSIASHFLSLSLSLSIVLFLSFYLFLYPKGSQVVEFWRLDLHTARFRVANPAVGCPTIHLFPSPCGSARVSLCPQTEAQFSG